MGLRDWLLCTTVVVGLLIGWVAEGFILATVYTMHILLDAKKAGYSVNQNMLDDATRYMSDFVAGNYNENSLLWFFNFGKGYMHYLLAREGSGRPNQIRDELKNTNNIEAKHLWLQLYFFLVIKL